MTLLAFSGPMTVQDITVFLLSLGVLLGSAKALGELARRFRQPSVLGEILAGILLGPTLLGTLSPTFSAWLFPASGPINVALSGITILGVVLLLLVAGLEVDLSSVWRQGKATVTVGVAGLILPLLVGFAMGWWLPGFLDAPPGQNRTAFALLFGIALAVTALPVIAKILIDLNMLKSDLGMLIMSAAMFQDLIGWLGMALVLALVGGDDNRFGVGNTILLTFVFVGVMLTVGRHAFHRILPAVQAHLSWPGGVLALVLVTALACGSYAEWIGVHAMFGAFIGGLAIGDSSHLHERTRDTILQFVTNIFAPVFFASIGLRVDFVEFFDLTLIAVVVGVSILVKVAGTLIGAKIGGMPRREGLAVAAGMTARGAMEIVVGQIALEVGLISETLFVALVVNALFTSLMAGPLMKRLLRLDVQRRLTDVVSEKGFVLRLRATRPREAIAELAERAGQVSRLPRRDVFHAVLRQERLMSSGLEHGIAVPRARLRGLKKPVIVIGLSDRGIDFDARDGQPARIICMILAPEDDHRAQVQLLQLVARALYTEGTRKAIMQAASFTQFRAVLSTEMDAIGGRRADVA